MAFRALRRRLADAGGAVALRQPVGSHGRREQAETRPGRLIEDAVVTTHRVGPPEPCPEPIAFLDGIQRHEVLGYFGASPVLGATVAAGVRERHGRRLVTAGVEVERFVVGRSEAISPLVRDDAYRLLPLPDGEPAHPIRDYDLAVALVDDARTRLEVRVGDVYRRRSDAWLIVDGSLTVSPSWAADPRMLGVSKSHATLPFEGEEAVTYLRLPAGARSSVFQPASRRVAPVYAWALRLWPWAERDLLFGLVRVEAAPTEASLAHADRWSRWLLAERAPVSSGDARWDRLLYGVHSVEASLAARVGYQ